MSTRKTISISERMHLFEELSDGSLYLELEDVGDCTFELWTNEDGTTSRALVRLSITTRLKLALLSSSKKAHTFANMLNDMSQSLTVKSVLSSVYLSTMRHHIHGPC